MPATPLFEEGFRCRRTEVTRTIGVAVALWGVLEVATIRLATIGFTTRIGEGNRCNDSSLAFSEIHLRWDIGN